MIREYRGKDKLTNEWVYGYIDQVYDTVYIVSHEYNTVEGDYTKTYEVIPETVGQATGINDNEGTEIFEGDIIKVAEQYTGVIIYKSGCWYVSSLNVLGFISYSMYVIGNIHDNPELLEKE